MGVAEEVVEENEEWGGGRERWGCDRWMFRGLGINCRMESVRKGRVTNRDGNRVRVGMGGIEVFLFDGEEKEMEG